tara:strand:- start:2299 stop:2955 length:657 start_codon:yes stop_codon:yes gene_type:complete
MSTSNWEDAKARSNYHFNKWHSDTECVTHLGKFSGGWHTELQAVIQDAKPLNWSNRRQGTGRENTNIDVEAEENDLRKAGADPKMTIYRGLKDFTKCPSLQKMTDFFCLDRVKSKLHIQFTGEVLNMHIDKLYDLDGDPNKVIRIMVMLQDWEPGQFIIYGNQQFDRWRAGDIHSFDWQNIPHATANASNKPRPMLVITGVKSEATKKILSSQIKKKI